MPARSSGAVVRRSRDGATYVKRATGEARDELAAERGRLAWLATTGLPAAAVVDWSDDGETATLTTTALPGVPLSDLPEVAADDAARSLGSFLARLHGLDRETCAFDRWLALTVPLARVRVHGGLVDEAAFDEVRRGRRAEDLLQVLLAKRRRAERLEVGDLVVCHGAACLPNFLIDPDTLEITGMVDVGRLGVADRHLDLALAVRSLSDATLNPRFGPAAAAAMLAAYGRPADPWRLGFYRLLDELF